MKGGKLFFLLKNLSKGEFKGLQKAVQSPIYNTNPKVMALFEAIRGQYPNFDNSSAGRAKIYAHVFPLERYKDQKLRRVFTELTRIAEHYLIFLELEKERFSREKILTRALGKRNMFDLFGRKTELLLEELETRPTQNADYFLSKSQLKEDLYFHPNHNKYDLSDNTLEDLTDSLDSYFAFEKMRLSVALKNKMKILKKPYRIRFSKAIRQEFEAGFLSENPIFQLYLLGTLLAEKDEKADLEQYEKLLFAYADELPTDDSLILFFNGLNYSVNRFNKGNITYSEVLLRWYKFGLKKGLLLQNGRLSNASFGNTVQHASLQGEYHWAENFIKDYGKFLNEETREEEENLGFIVIHLYKKEFQKVISKITNYPFSNRLVLRTRSMLVISYFELFLMDRNYFKVLQAQLKAFENFLFRNTIFSPQKVESNINLVRVLKGLSRRIENQTPVEKTRKWLRRQIQTRKKITDKRRVKQWFGLT